MVYRARPDLHGDFYKLILKYTAIQCSKQNIRGCGRMKWRDTEDNVTIGSEEDILGLWSTELHPKIG